MIILNQIQDLIKFNFLKFKFIFEPINSVTLL